MNIFQKCYSPGTSFNSEADLDTVLDKTSFQGYQKFISVPLTTVHRPLKDGRCFKYFHSDFIKSHQPDPPRRSWNP